MELIVLDTSLKMLSVLDTFESLIWTERYSAYGDFEVYTSINDSILEILKDDYYLWLKESDQTMIVEDRKIESDAENGNHFTVTGRSLESILERRIIWKQTILSGNFQNGIEKLLDENIINPSDASRKVERLIFEASTDRYLMLNYKNRIDQLASMLTSNIRAANSIYPTTLHEYEQRRDYQNTAIVNCEQLLKELQRIVEIFEVDVNLYSRYVKAIDREIGLIKKWRQRDNRIRSQLKG